MDILEVPRPNPEWLAKYQLDEDETTQRIRDLLSAYPPDTEDRFVCYQLQGDSKAADVARTVECGVFKELGDSPEDMTKIYGPYEQASTFLLSIDQEEGRAVGALRIIRNSSAGLMAVNTMPDEALELPIEDILQLNGIDNLDECWDIGTIAVLREYRGQSLGISSQLYRALYISVMQQDIKHLVCIYKKAHYEALRNVLGVPMEQMQGTRLFPFAKVKENVAGHLEISKIDSAMREHLSKQTEQLIIDLISSIALGTRDDTIFFPDDYKN